MDLRMTKHGLFYLRYASFANAQLPLLNVAALYIDKFKDNGFRC